MIDPTLVFVYGTLRPGEERWSLLEPYVKGAGHRTTVPGRLYDTGLGYPAAVFTGPGPETDTDVGGRTAHVVGVTFELIADTIDDALTVLDEIEGAVEGLYRRLIVTTAMGDRVWVYEWGGGIELVAIASGDWLSR